MILIALIFERAMHLTNFAPNQNTDKEQAMSQPDVYTISAEDSYSVAPL